MTTLTESDQQRLSQIRADNLKWLSTTAEARGWDTTFLIHHIDRQNAEIKRLRGERK